MDFQTIQNKLSAIVAFKAEKLTAVNATELKTELLALNKNGINNIVLDLSFTKYCDSSGLSSILTGNRICKDTNGKFILCGLQPAVLKVIQIAQLDKVLILVSNQEEAAKVFEN
jgi:anti-sigma B factor antagonist